MAEIQSKHQWLITSEMEGLGTQTWASISSVTTSASTKEVWDGGSLTPDLLTAVATHGTGTLSRPWKPARDMAVYKTLLPVTGQLFFTIKQTPTDVNLRAQGAAIVFRALLTDISTPDSAAGAQTDEDMLTVTFKAQKIT